jgi:MFS family permease
MAFFIIFPYVNEMVERIGHQKPENVGFWTGSIESLFSIVQMLLIIFYGRLADRLGRKPVLVFSLAGIAAASALFGMSSSLPQMIVFRCTAGLFAGSSVTIRAMLSENCTKKTQGKAFAWFMFARYFYRSSQTRAITLTKCLDNLEFL